MVEHDNEYYGCLYGKSSMTIYKGNLEVLHTGSRNINTPDELFELLSEMPEMFENIDNPLSDYQPPSEEAMINFGIDISKEMVEKYALEKFGRLPQSRSEMTRTMESKIIEETRRFMSNGRKNQNNI
jgi:hypothetical protein